MMKNFQQKLIEIVGIDRLLHFAFGGWIACFIPAWQWALLTVFVIGFLKELVYDKWIKKSKFDYIDWFATFAGAVVSVGINSML